MATSIDSIIRVTQQNSGYLYRSSSWYGSYSNATTPVFQDVLSISSSGDRIYFNFTLNDVGKIAIWVLSLASGFTGSPDLGSPTNNKTLTPTGWTTVFSASRDYNNGAEDTINALTYIGLMAATKLITRDDVATPYYEVNSTTDFVGSNSCAAASNLFILDVKAKNDAMQSPQVICRTGWNQEKSNATSPQRIYQNALSATNSTGVFEIAAAVGKRTTSVQTMPTVSLGDENGIKSQPIDSVADSANTSTNGAANGVIKYRFIRNASNSYYNQPTFNSNGNTYSCGGYAAIRIGG